MPFGGQWLAFLAVLILVIVLTGDHSPTILPKQNKNKIPLAGHEQWVVTDRGFDLFVHLAGPAMADSLCLRRGKTLGHGIILISRRLDRF